MFDRVRISAKGKQQLISIKRKTGISQYNAICRYALVLSLEEESIPPTEEIKMKDGIEIDWKVFCSGETNMYYNLLVARCLKDGLSVTQENLRNILTLHLHRGIAYLYAKPMF